MTMMVNVGDLSYFMAFAIPAEVLTEQDFILRPMWAQDVLSIAHQTEGSAFNFFSNRLSFTFVLWSARVLVLLTCTEALWGMNSLQFHGSHTCRNVEANMCWGPGPDAFIWALSHWSTREALEDASLRCSIHPIHAAGSRGCHFKAVTCLSLVALRPHLASCPH